MEEVNINSRPILRLRKYLQEWKDEQAYSEKYCKHPESVPDFSWRWHDQELISIQGGIREAYGRADAEELAMLTAEEKAEIEKILSYEVID